MEKIKLVALAVSSFLVGVGVTTVYFSSATLETGGGSPIAYSENPDPGDADTALAAPEFFSESGGVDPAMALPTGMADSLISEQADAEQLAQEQGGQHSATQEFETLPEPEPQAVQQKAGRAASAPNREPAKVKTKTTAKTKPKAAATVTKSTASKKGARKLASPAKASPAKAKKKIAKKPKE